MKTRLIWIGVGLAVAALSQTADPEVEKLLAKMRQVYSSAKTAHIVVKTTAPRFGNQAVTTDVTYMKDRKIYAKVTGPTKRIFISDGKRISFDDLSGNTMQSNFDLDAIPIPVNLEVMSFWDWKRQLSTSPGSNMETSKFKLKLNVPWNGKKWTLLQETAYGQGVYADYYIDPKTSLIYRVCVYDLQKSQLRTETNVVKLERDVKVNPALFKVKALVRELPKIKF
ncbi:MAG TPA: hypothetical protein VJ835_10890 [Fimbriimonadaceae bacterium]|nr:hypothetical protein [Fimbriimonadaceae bacterium]